MKERRFYGGAALLALAAAGLLGWLTPFGAGVGPTSVVSLAGARSLLAGQGFAMGGEPITHFPPLYSLVLAAIGSTGIELVEAARGLNAVLLGLNVVLVAGEVRALTRRDELAAVLAAGFFLASSPLLMLHVMAWPEPLFIALILTGTSLLARYVEQPKPAFAVGAALAFGLAAVTRYAGIFLLPAAALVVFVGAGGPRLRQVRESCRWLLVAGAPLAILLAHNAWRAQSATNRSAVFHPLALPTYLRQVLNNLLEFLAPVPLPVGLRPALVGLLGATFLALLVPAIRRGAGQLGGRSRELASVAIGFLLAATYFLALYLSISLFDAATPVNSRLLSPIFVILTVATFALFFQMAKLLEKPAVWRGFLLLVLLLIAAKSSEAVRSLAGVQRDGAMYTSRQWRESAGVAFVSAAADGRKIYSNATDVLDFLTTRQTWPIPEKISTQTRLANPRFDEEVAAMCRDLEAQQAVLLYFDAINWRLYLPTVAELAPFCRLVVIRELADAKVYGSGPG